MKKYIVFLSGFVTNVVMAATKPAAVSQISANIADTGHNLMRLFSNLLLVVGIGFVMLCIPSLLVPVVVNSMRRKKLTADEYKQKSMSYIKLPLILLAVGVIAILLPVLIPIAPHH